MRVHQAFDHPLPSPIGARSVLPAIAALWFALVVGLGTLILPATLVSRLALATGFASLAPALSVPLDLTARGAIALVAAGLGAMAGVALMRLVGIKRYDASLTDRPAGHVIRPLSARDELGDLFDWAEAESSEARHEADIPLFHGTAEADVGADVYGLPSGPAGRLLSGSDLIPLAERLRSAIERRRAWKAGPVLPESSAAGIELAVSELTAQARADCLAKPREPRPETVNAGPAAEDADSALRASLARLRQLRGAA